MRSFIAVAKGSEIKRGEATVVHVADALFAGGTLSYIAESGSVGDSIYSLNRLRCFNIVAIYPGHGRISTNAAEDIDRALVHAQKLLKADADRKWNIFFQKEKSEAENMVDRPGDA